MIFSYIVHSSYQWEKFYPIALDSCKDVRKLKSYGTRPPQAQSAVNNNFISEPAQLWVGFLMHISHERR
nr:MAG TPA: hypothetical protein [Caudoviricetes sp.]